MKTLINVEQITIIGVYPQKESTEFKWFDEEKVFFGLWKYNKGFWRIEKSLFSDKEYKREICSESFINSCNCKIEDKKCYNKANIIIHLSCGNWNRIYFNTDEEMYNYLAQPELKNIKFIEL